MKLRRKDLISNKKINDIKHVNNRKDGKEMNNEYIKQETSGEHNIDDSKQYNNKAQ